MTVDWILSPSPLPDTPVLARSSHRTNKALNPYPLRRFVVLEFGDHFGDRVPPGDGLQAIIEVDELGVGV